ncbi:MAG: ABC transporter ATP-binding protein [Candidatus Nanopelagicales bacterium]|nr:ABC transporter ATP-binding protein [Candidatus Nanopelagicales bacterium]MCF8538618.1 ABC transporter ATP-binding protein [Candidatus Nanopelagicales bacterium]MCF8541987.1 ABC transporter ATP-binding protein [Candidatus Nanopelagicales bacterium]
MSTPKAGAPAHNAGAPAAVELRGITKRYGSIVVCDDVRLTVHRGEIHGLLGQNGAGKSTLVKILIGLAQRDAGEILLEGRTVDISDPLAAADLGIAMVHQHFSLVEELTVWENVTLGEAGRPDARRTRDLVRDIGLRYGLDVDPDARVEDLSTGERQRVEIIKCLRRDPSLLILDEPTSVLTLAESRELFTVLRHVAQGEGKTVILISHKLDEILSATDHVTIMRSGRIVAQRATAATDERELAREMVGRELSKWVAASALGDSDALIDPSLSTDPAMLSPVEPIHEDEFPVRLRIHEARVSRDGRPLLQGLSLDLRAGEILGLAGVEGNGQQVLGDLLSSLVELDSGTVEMDGVALATGRPGVMHMAGIGVIPEDRHASGCVLDMSVAENLVMSTVESVARRGFVSRKAIRANAERLIEQFEIATPSPDTPMRQLSGGNQQKVVLARELSLNPRVLVAAYPTRGLDVGAIEYMTERLHDAAASGIAVLLISTELEEILTLSHHIAVIHRGSIVGQMRRVDVDAERLGLMMGGQVV